MWSRAHRGGQGSLHPSSTKLSLDDVARRFATPSTSSHLMDLVSQRSGIELFGSDSRNWSSACADALLGGACKVMMCAPPVPGNSSLVRVRYRSPTSG